MTRLNKYLAEKNIASRREADALIAAGKVFVNGTKAVMGMQVGETDTVEVRNNTKEYAYFAYNKPIGIVTATPQRGETDIVHQLKIHQVPPTPRNQPSHSRRPRPLGKHSQSVITCTTLSCFICPGISALQPAPPYHSS